MKKVIMMMMVLVTTICFSSIIMAAGQSDGEQVQGGTQSEDNIIAEKVELELYSYGDRPRGYDDMLAELNKLIEEELNATLRVNFIGWGERHSKYPLLLSGGEKFEMIFTANWSYYWEQAQLGGFLKLNDLVPQYAPLCWENINQKVWNETQVDGNYYMVPYNFKEFTGFGFFYRKDLADKYGISDVDTLEDIESLMAATKKENPKIIPYNGTKSERMALSIQLIEKYNLLSLDGKMDSFMPHVPFQDLEAQPIDRFTEAYFLDWLKMVRRWYENGYIPKNILNNEVLSIDSMKNGLGIVSVRNAPSALSDRVKMRVDHPDWEFGYLGFEKNLPGKRLGDATQGGIAINRTAANPERALMLLDKLHNDQRYYYLTWYGVEGDHYKIEDGQYVPLKPDEFNKGSGFPHGWRETKYDLPIQGMKWEDDERRMETYLKKAFVYPFQRFSPDSNLLQAEKAALDEVWIQYGQPLMWGMIDDVEEGLQIYLAKREEAGYTKVRDQIYSEWKDFYNEYVK